MVSSMRMFSSRVSLFGGNQYRSETAEGDWVISQRVRDAAEPVWDGMCQPYIRSGALTPSNRSTFRNTMRVASTSTRRARVTGSASPTTRQVS